MKINKKVLIIIISILVVLIVAGAFYLNGKKVKKYSIAETVSVNGLEISNGKLTQNKSITTHTINVVSKKNDYEFKYIEITIYSGKGKYVLKGYSGNRLEKGKSVKISSSIDTAIDDNAKVSYKVIK